MTDNKQGFPPRKIYATRNGLLEGEGAFIVWTPHGPFVTHPIEDVPYISLQESEDLLRAARAEVWNEVSAYMQRRAELSGNQIEKRVYKLDAEWALEKAKQLEGGKE